MAATTTIAPGDRLSIDYGNNFYSPTLVRKLTLFESYGFLCACRLCDGATSTDGAGAGAGAGADETIGVDRKRAFWCVPCKQKGQQGIVCPMGPTSVGLRATLQDPSGLRAVVQSVKKGNNNNSNSSKGGNGKKGGKSKSKSNKKSPLKSSSVMATDEDEGDEQEEAEEAVREQEKPLNLVGVDTERLADALERVPLTWAGCSTCGTVPTANYIKKCISREEHYRQNPPETYEEVLEAGIESNGCLHESHHLLFQALDVISHDMTNQARRLSVLEEGDKKPIKGKGKSKGGGVAAEKRQHALFDPALAAIQHCVRLLDQVLPLVHQEKVVFYDRLGQLAVCAGQTELARGVFSAAHQLSELASGASAPQTQQLLALAERPPQTREELMSHYAKSNDMEVEGGG